MTQQEEKITTENEENLEQAASENSKNNTPQNENLENSSPQEEINSLKEKLSRAQADYQNLVMRNERDRADMTHYLTVKLISPLLAQLDHLDRAVAIKDGVT